MARLPDALRGGPFTRAEAARLGITSRMLDGRAFTRIYPRVWRQTAHEMTGDDWVAAARLALPARAHLTGLSRLHQCGLDFGPVLPVRFVVEGDLHLCFDNVFLHRTKKLPPVDDIGVTVPAAFIAWCASARVVDAIKVGDWLLRHGHMTETSVRDLALAELWRPGADEAVWVLPHLHAASRSLPESELRSVLGFSGLPEPEVNAPIQLLAGVTVRGDLLYRQWRTIVEYEGAHHQVDRGQYSDDLDRYALLRAHDLRYVQVTKEKLARPRRVVGEVFRALVAGGYDGPPPRFGQRWELLFHRLAAAVGPRARPTRPAGGSATS